MVPIAEVASAYVSILPSARGFGSKLDGQISGDVTASGKKAGSGWGKAFGIGAALVVGAKAFSFASDAVAEASDLSESASKVGVVFGKQADQILKASKTSATAMGLSKAAYLGATGSLGNLLVSLDIAPKKAAGLSQEMVKLAGDMASFNNTSPEEALAALQSGLTGETEPLKRFGVNMNDATLKAQAFKDGLIESTKEALTPQAKALAAQALIMDQTATSQGDFARTSGGLANQQRILAAQFDNVKATVGTALLPVITRAVTFINTAVLPTVMSFISSLKSGSGSAGQFAGFIDRVVVSVRSLAQWISGTVIPAVKGALVPVIARGRTEFAKLKAAVQQNQPQLQQFLGGLKSVANFVATRVVPVLVKLHAQTFVNLIAGVRFVINVISAGVNAFNNIRAAIIKGGEAAGKFTSAVKEKIGSAISFLKGIPSQILGIFTSLGTQMYAAGGKIVSMLAAGIRAKAEDALGALRDIAGKLKNLVPGSPVKDGPLKSLNNGHAGAMIPQMLADGINKNADAPVKAMGKVAKKLKDKLSGVRDNLTSTLDGLKSDFKSLSESVSSAFTGNLFEAATGSDFVANLMGKRGELTSLLASFKTLKGWGLDPAFLSQLFASGNGALITELAGMGQAGATQAGALFGEVTSLSNQLGNAVAKNDPVSDRIDITNKKLDAVIDRLDRVGGDVGKAVNGAVVGGHKSGKRGKK